jgi:hypothetical protein
LRRADLIASEPGSPHAITEVRPGVCRAHDAYHRAAGRKATHRAAEAESAQRLRGSRPQDLERAGNGSIHFLEALLHLLGGSIRRTAGALKLPMILRHLGFDADHHALEFGCHLPSPSCLA